MATTSGRSVTVEQAAGIPLSTEGGKAPSPEVIGKALRKKDKVAVVGFGTFMVRERKARMGRNPKTKEQIKIKASRTPAFKAGKALKDAIK